MFKSTARLGDLICRLGGEEFAVICLGADRAGAMQLAERIRVAIEHSEVLGAGRQWRTAPLSVGAIGYVLLYAWPVGLRA